MSNFPTEKENFQIHYQKNDNETLFETFEKELQVYNIQNYIPLYTRYFNLNESNYSQEDLNRFDRYYKTYLMVEGSILTKKFYSSNSIFYLGFFYGRITGLLGYTPCRHEGKITGLAAYGNPQNARKLMEKMINYTDGHICSNLGEYYRPF